MKTELLLSHCQPPLLGRAGVGVAEDSEHLLPARAEVKTLASSLPGGIHPCPLPARARLAPSRVSYMM